MILNRFTQNDRATHGILKTEDASHSWFTLELPWKDNQHGVSCIPAGTYVCQRRWSERHQSEVFGLLNVPERSDIELHVANFARQLLGCIALGTQVLDIDGDGEDDVQHSRQAFDEFMALMKDVDTFELTINDQ